MGAVFPRFSHRADASVPAFDDSGHVVVVDGSCGVCSRGARMLARRDTRQEFSIATSGSDLGRALFLHYGLDPVDPESWLYLREGEALFSLDAVIAVATRLGGSGRLAAVLWVLPKGLRDWLYRRIARNRYRIMGRTDLCALPDPALRKRLIG